MKLILNDQVWRRTVTTAEQVDGSLIPYDLRELIYRADDQSRFLVVNVLIDGPDGQMTMDEAVIIGAMNIYW